VEPEITPEITSEVTLLTNENSEIIPEGLPKKYTVQKGDNLWKIAETNYTSGYNWVDIAKENNIDNPGLLYVGQELTLPRTEVIVVSKGEITDQAAINITSDTYTIQKGDNLWKIAVNAYADGYKWPEIAKYNNIEDSNRIYPGDTLKLPR